MTTTTDADVAAEGGLTIQDAVLFAGVSRRTLYKAMADGQLAYCRVGRRKVVLKVALRQWLRDHLARPCEHDG